MGPTRRLDNRLEPRLFLVFRAFHGNRILAQVARNQNGLTPKIETAHLAHFAGKGTASGEEANDGAVPPGIPEDGG